MAKRFAAVRTSVTSRYSFSRLTHAWLEFLASDPGHMRFRSACRATLSGALTGTLLGFLVVQRVIPVGAAGIGVALSIMGVLFARAPSPGQRALTIGCMALGGFASATVATLLAIWPYLSDLGFLALLFAVVALQTRGPRFVATGILSVLSAYLALFLRLTPAQAPTVLLALALAASVVLFVDFVLLPERPGDALQRLIRALERRASVLLHAVASAKSADDPARLRARRSLAKLNEAILSAEEWLAAIAPSAVPGFRTEFARFQLALANVAVAAAAAQPLENTEVARIRLAALRLHAGRRARLRHRPWSGNAPLRTALEVLESTAAVLATLARDGIQTAAAPRPASDMAARPPLAWRPATRAAAAAVLSMVVGNLLSPDRWFWAALTAYLLFINVRSRGETVFKGVQRIWGALAGLAVGLLVSFAFAGHVALEAAGILACLFGVAYSFPLLPALTSFCLTVLFGLAYGLAGAQVGAVLALRLEETCIGVASALVAGFLVFPRATREHVHEVGRNLLAALAEVVRTSARRLAGDVAASPLGAMRQADRIMRDLRTALRPLQASRALTLAPTSTELPAVIACMFWVRHLATLSEAASSNDPGEARSARAFRLASKLDDLIRDESSLEKTIPARTADGSADEPSAIGLEHIGAPTNAVLDITLDNLESALDLLAAWLRAEGWSALEWK